MEKRIPIIIAGAIAVAIAAAAGGFFLGRSGDATSGTSGVRNGPGGAFAQLTEAERTSLQSMTAEERQAFFEEKGMPAGGPGGTAPDGSSGRGTRGGGLIQGKVAALSDDSLTIELDGGGSSKIDLTADTVKASVEGAGTLAVGSSVMVSAIPEAEGVMTAQLVVVR